MSRASSSGVARRQSSKWQSVLPIWCSGARVGGMLTALDVDMLNQHPCYEMVSNFSPEDMHWPGFIVRTSASVPNMNAMSLDPTSLWRTYDCCDSWNPTFLPGGHALARAAKLAWPGRLRCLPTWRCAEPIVKALDALRLFAYFRSHNRPDKAAKMVAVFDLTVVARNESMNVLGSFALLSGSRNPEFRKTLQVYREA